MSGASVVHTTSDYDIDGMYMGRGSAKPPRPVVSLAASIVPTCSFPSRTPWSGGADHGAATVVQPVQVLTGAGLRRQLVGVLFTNVLPVTAVIATFVQMPPGPVACGAELLLTDALVRVYVPLEL
ncbi:hypothetical protein OV450_6110 [Actinobacteria bacterium OV450]|nr:hypothetical protein OV450_6110 [Actinobacteria bacterium OV450]